MLTGNGGPNLLGSRWDPVTSCCKLSGHTKGFEFFWSAFKEVLWDMDLIFNVDSFLKDKYIGSWHH